jgi:hypothetical protein
MKISPDPLQPLRTWRELWLTEPSAAELARRCQSDYQSRHWKKQKQTPFNWLSHMLNRDV